MQTNIKNSGDSPAQTPANGAASEAVNTPADQSANTPANKTSLWELFWAFAKIGALTFGGGYAMLPMLERECVDKHGWVTKEELLDYFAIGQCTPGVIAVNTATFIGSNERGALGAALATLGVVTPSIIIILIIAMVLQNFAHIPAVQHAFSGIRAAVAALILKAIISLVKTSVRDWLSIAICAAAFLLVVLLGVSPVFVVLGAGLVGIGSFKLKEAKR